MLTPTLNSRFSLQRLQPLLIPLPQNPYGLLLLHLRHELPVRNPRHRPVRVDDHWSEMVEFHRAAVFAEVEFGRAGLGRGGAGVGEDQGGLVLFLLLVLFVFIVSAVVVVVRHGGGVDYG